jgi:hypothetical protein
MKAQLKIHMIYTVNCDASEHFPFFRVQHSTEYINIVVQNRITEKVLLFLKKKKIFLKK